MSNPYQDEFGILPMAEMRRMLFIIKSDKKFGGGRKSLSYVNQITLGDVQRENKLSPQVTLGIMRNTPITGHHSFGKKRQQRLSRWLIKEACGMIVKRDGKVVYLKEPTKPMPVIRRVTLGMCGPQLTAPKQLAEVPRSMPKFMDLFKSKPTINLPRGLK